MNNIRNKPIKGRQSIRVNSYVSWARPKAVPGPYNIMDRTNHRLMLGMSVDVINSLWWLEYYCTRYGCEMFEIVEAVGSIHSEVEHGGR